MRFPLAVTAIFLALCMNLDTHAAQALPVEEATFGKTADGTEIKLFTLRNRKGMVAKVMSYGAILTDLEAPDKHGVTTNVVLGTNDCAQYLRGFPAAAAVMGRVANRIGNSRFSLDGVEYRLKPNNGANHLHGVFDKVAWQVERVSPGGNEASVRFRYLSRDGEDGFPGNLTVSVTYTLTSKNELRLDYEASTDKATPVNLTSHAYFNLRGHGDVLEQILWLAAKRYTPADEQLIPTGQLASVKGTPLDFTKPTALGARIEQLKPRLNGYDHNFVLDHGGLRPGLAARLRDPESGRVMEVRTTQPGLQLYTGNHVNHRGVCFETQHFPDSINHPEFPSTVLRPGETFRSTTVFAFSNE